MHTTPIGKDGIMHTVEVQEDPVLYRNLSTLYDQINLLGAEIIGYNLQHPI